MTKVIFSAKVVMIWLYNVLLAPAPKVLQMTLTPGQNSPPEWLLGILVLLMFVPEFMVMFSKDFRTWIKEGIEDSDGKLSKKDTRDMIVLYGSLWCLRVFLLMSWAIIFYDKEIDWFIYVTPLIGSFGISGLTVIQSIIGRK